MNNEHLDPHIDLKLKELVTSSIGRADNRLRRDLWPQLHARLQEQPKRSPVMRFRLKWWEWALAAGDLGAAWYAPEAIPALLYHL